MAEAGAVAGVEITDVTVVANVATGTDVVVNAVLAVVEAAAAVVEAADAVAAVVRNPFGVAGSMPEIC